MNFAPYVVQLFTPEQAAEVARHAEQNLFSGAHDVPARNTVKTADTKIIQWRQIKQYLDWSMHWVHFFNTREIGLDIFDMRDLDFINYNVYSADRQGEYQWHIDGKPGPSDIKITAVINVSTEPFEGGDLELFTNGPVVCQEIRRPGTLVIFPSLIMHRVTPVTRGVRKTISYWVMGPNFR